MSSASQQGDQDPDLLALQRLPHVSPLVKPSDALTAMFSRAKQPDLPSLHSAAMQQLCRDYAAYCRDAATPLCEGQKTLAKKMCGLEALCARILYLLALRFNELSGCAATLRDVPLIATKLQEIQSSMVHPAMTESALRRLEPQLTKAAGREQLLQAGAGQKRCQHSPLE